MTFKEMSWARQTAWVQNIRWKLLMIIVSVLVIFVIWESPPPSFFSYSQLSASQIQSFSGKDGIPNIAPANTSSYSAPANIPTVHDHTDSTGADSFVPETKQRPVEETKPDPNSNPSVNTTTDSESTPNVIEDDTQLLPDNSTVHSEAPTNATSDVFIEEDTQLVDPSTLKAQDYPQPSASEEKKYLVPSLSGQVGTGNQLMEYKSAAVIARTLNRTLCLIPFSGGPPRHLGHLGDRHSGLDMEGRYDIDILSKFVKVANMEECTEQCKWKLDVQWRLRSPRPPDWKQWFNDTPRWGVDLSREYSRWLSTADVKESLGPRNEGHCVGLTGIFPGLQWRGVVIAASTYMQHSAQVMKYTDLLQARGLPNTSDNNFVADGAVIANAHRSETWETMKRENLTNHPSRAGFNGVALAKEDISGAIYDRVVQRGVKSVYIASDGWIRGKESGDVFKWVVEDLRSKGIDVAGLWMLEGLSNFGDGFYASAGSMGELFGLDPKQTVSNHIISLVEQEICLRAAVFLGSGQSTWSLAVSDTRRGLRCKQELTERMSGLNLGTSPEVLEQAIIDKILTIHYEAGPVCTGAVYNSTMQKYDDEIPDGWLDYEACEVRLLQGKGNCQRITV